MLRVDRWLKGWAVGVDALTALVVGRPPHQLLKVTVDTGGREDYGIQINSTHLIYKKKSFRKDITICSLKKTKPPNKKTWKQGLGFWGVWHECHLVVILSKHCTALSVIVFSVPRWFPWLASCSAALWWHKVVFIDGWISETISRVKRLGRGRVQSIHYEERSEAEEEYRITFVCWYSVTKWQTSDKSASLYTGII